ncbi:MAG: C/D box methylation guide ribonucleoprotein complex aNOP56 subunit [Candidatus Micrarchaeia archaeon]
MASREDFFKLAKKGVTEKYSRKDLQIMQAVRSLDDIDQAKSLLFTRLAEWFKLNFPELDVANEESYALIVAEFGSKEGLSKAKLVEMVGEAKGGEVFAASKKSFGAPFDEADTAVIRAFASQIYSLFAARKVLEDYITEQANREMKNLSYILEPTIAARLMTTAGGLEKLALMPASTIQVIGAENALFKHIKSGTNPPKHGIIFQSAYVRGEPLERRGRIARALAAKLAIAAKGDYFSGNFIAEKLKADLDARVKEVVDLNLAPRRELTEDEKFRRDFGFSKRGPGSRGGPGGDRRQGDRRNGRPKQSFQSKAYFARREGGNEAAAGGYDRPARRYDAPREGSSRPSYGDKPRYGGGDRPSYGGNRPSFGGSRGGSRDGGSRPSFGGKPRFGGGRRDGKRERSGGKFRR